MGFGSWWVNISGGWSRLPMGLDVGLLPLCGCKGFGDLIVGSRLEVSGWLQNLGFFFFWVIFSGSSLRSCFNRSVFALIPKLTQDNQNKTETMEK